jgi:hypothetical protein
VSTKASQLQAASEKLRQCNRTASGALSRPVPGTGGAASPPASSDEFHSTERPGFFSPECACETARGPDQTASGGDTFSSNTPGSDQGQPVPQPNPLDGPLPWEQPAQAQTPWHIRGTITTTLKWDEIVVEFGQKKRRKGHCTTSITFYSDGQAVATKSTYLNEDRTAPYPPRINVEKIEGDQPQPRGLYRSNLKLVRRANGNYDISWTNPIIRATQSLYYEYPKDSGLPPQDSGAPLMQKDAHCMGRDNGSLVTVRFPNVPLQGKTPDDLPVEAQTSIRDDLEKQAPHLTINMRWSFEPPDAIPPPRGYLLDQTKGQPRR